MNNRVRYLLFSMVIILLLPLPHLRAQNKIHPPFYLLDEQGNRLPAGTRPFSTLQSCQPCHDTHYINLRNTHYNQYFKTDCLACHLNLDPQLPADLPLNQRLQTPRLSNCAQCHGLVTDCREPLVFPADLLTAPTYALTLNKGVIISPQNLSRSGLNLQEKEQLNYPWDIHFRRQMDCTSCHFTANDPRICAENTVVLDHLKRDPRRVKSTQDYMKWPDHRYKTASCTCCHDPYLIHPNLPYKKRHFETLSCESCHVPRLYGPALRSEDMTVVTPDGDPRREFRSIDTPIPTPLSPSTAYIRGYRPTLLTTETPEGKPIIAPFNLVTRWKWISRQSGKPIDRRMVSSAYLSDGNYRPEILRHFDRDQNGKIDPRELVLDSPEKVETIRRYLMEQGIEDAVVKGTITPYRIYHGVVNIKRAVSDCGECHSPESRLGGNILLSGTHPRFESVDFATFPVLKDPGLITSHSEHSLHLQDGTRSQNFYIFGFSRMSGIDQLGWGLLILVLLGICIHAATRIAGGGKPSPHPSGDTRPVYLYTFYERLWHWLTALSVLLLIGTGFEIHHGNTLPVLGYGTAVRVHNIMAFLVIVNTLLLFFYQLATGEIRQFFRVNRLLLKETFGQSYYYLYGMFRGEPHPVAKTRERKLNPLQQITYSLLLFFMLPLQIGSGLLLWIQGHWPDLVAREFIVGTVTPVHNLLSWLILIFLVVHLYLITTGRTVFSNLRAMISGYDLAEPDPPLSDAALIKTMSHREYLKYLAAKIKKKGGPR